MLKPWQKFSKVVIRLTGHVVPLLCEVGKAGIFVTVSKSK
jgi:hypothetical protein